MNSVYNSNLVSNVFKNSPKISNLPELEITPVINFPVDEAQYRNGVETTQKKQKVPREQMDIHRLLIKLPVLYEYFDIHKKIGEGTYSSVYLATIKNSNGQKRFAIKHLTQNFSLPRIQKELKFMQLIGGQDNVVSVLNCLKNGSDDCIVFVMPYLEHRRFSEYVLQMDSNELKIYMKNLFIALRRVHTFNVIHRDVKPGNFLYNRETKQFLLVDFGLAQQIENRKKDKLGDISDHENMPIDYSKRKRSPSDSSNRPSKKTLLSPLKSRENIIVNSSGRLADHSSPVAAQVVRPDVEMTPQKSRSHTSSSLSSSSSRKKLFCDESSPTISVFSNGSSRRPSLGTSLLKSKTENKLFAASNERPVSRVQRSFTPLVANKAQVGSFVQVRNSQVVAQKQGGCFCAGVGVICSTCQGKRALTAPRAGTPGFRPPEVLLKCLHQTTAVDMWAAGVIMLCVLSGCYPFFKSPSDISALVEIMTIFGRNAVEKVAAKFGRRVTCSASTRPIDLRKLCRRMRARRAKKDEKNEKNKCSDCENFIPGAGCLCRLEDVPPTNTCSDGDAFPDSAYNLLLRLLDLDPATRITAEEALNHPFITNID